MARLVSPADLKSLVGGELGQTPWQTMSQDQIDAFAAATGDRQWIHCDRERAARESPYGATVAHGCLTLSLLPALIGQIVQIEPARLIVNYGLNRVRFPHPITAGSQFRLALRLLDVQDRDNALDAVYRCTLEVQGAPKPACVAELVLRVYS